MGRRECLKVGLKAAWLCFLCEAESKMTCWGDGSVMPQGLGLARDHCAGICSLFFFTLSSDIPLSLSLLVSSFPSDSPVFSISWCCPPPQSNLCLSSSVSWLSLSHDKKLLRTIMHPAFVFCKCTLLSSPFLICSAAQLKITCDSSFGLYHCCTTMLWNIGVHNQGGNM